MTDTNKADDISEKSKFSDYISDEKILKAVKDLGYINPSKVQEQVIPLALTGRDLIVKSQTGSGKTAAFGIPICTNIEIEERYAQALVLAPTRELAVQIKEEITNIGRYKRIRSAAVFGKQPMEFQTKELKQRVHIIVGTPGRTLDHLKRGNINTDKLKYFIIDEADEMLSLGFIEQLKDIIAYLPKQRTTMLFSATVPEKIEELCKSYMVNPSKVEINPEKLTVERIDQRYYEVEEENKFEILNRILYLENPDSCILFCKTKENVGKLIKSMKRLDYPCMELHGGMEQSERLSIMKDFKRGAFRFLVTTDVAARGIDIEQIDLVVNYDVPAEKERYVHRIGRTARAGKEGKAITFVTERDNRQFQNIQEYINKDILKDEIPAKDFSEKHKADFMAKNEKKPMLREEKGASLSKDIMKLYIAGGKDKKVRPGDIVGAITSMEGITVDDIGIIDVQDRYSHVDILNGKGKKVLEFLKNSKIKGKSLKVERANR